jgi:hypothetical protein
MDRGSALCTGAARSTRCGRASYAELRSTLRGSTRRSSARGSALTAVGTCRRGDCCGATARGSLERGSTERGWLDLGSTGLGCTDRGCTERGSTERGSTRRGSTRVPLCGVLRVAPSGSERRGSAIPRRWLEELPEPAPSTMRGATREPFPPRRSITPSDSPARRGGVGPPRTPPRITSTSLPGARRAVPTLVPERIGAPNTVEVG